MATQEQLKYLQRQCQYLRYTEKSSLPFVEKFSGSLEMFSPVCHNTKASKTDRRAIDIKCRGRESKWGRTKQTRKKEQNVPMFGFSPSVSTSVFYPPSQLPPFVAFPNTGLEPIFLVVVALLSR